MLTEFLKANVRNFVDIEASEGADGETTDSNDDGMLPRPKYFLMLISYQQERMASSTTTAARRTWNRQKKTKMLIVRALQTYVLLYDETYDSAVHHAVPCALSDRNCSSVLDPSAARARNDSMPLDRRLEEVINRYGAQTAGPHDEIQDGSPNVFWNEKITSIADGVTRMPSDDDAPLWRVRVQVSLSLISALVWRLTR
jgi:hypothetical protein